MVKRKQKKDSPAASAPVVNADELGVHIISPEDTEMHFGSEKGSDTDFEPADSASSDKPKKRSTRNTDSTKEKKGSERT